MSDEQLYDIGVVNTNCPLCGSSDETYAKGVNLRFLLEEVATCRDSHVDGCPMTGVLVIAIRSPCVLGLYELSDEGEVFTFR
jgi:hypothetical protein